MYAHKDSEDICRTDWRNKITESEKACLDAMTDRLQKSMNTFTADGFAFVKTSSRSAKDAPLVQNELKGLYRKELDAFPAAERSENIQITCLLKAAFIALRVKSAEEVVDMFLRSERIYQDMILAAVNQKDKYNEHFVIRKFVDIDVDMEFRGFVWNYELVALSQYNYAIFSKRLLNGKEMYGDMVREYFYTSIQPKLKDSKFPKNSIIDFAICDEGKV